MSDYYAVVYSDSLSHHGIKGQKWGQRRYQNEDGSLTDAGRSRYGNGPIGRIRQRREEKRVKRLNEVNSELRELKGYAKNPKGLAASKVSTAIRNHQIKSLEKTKLKLDPKAREAKKAETRNKVREYKKQFDKASEMSDAADEKWREARSQYDSLAKTRVGRIREVIKAQKGNGSAAAKEYLKNADIASEMQDKADEAWRETHKKRMATGKTAVGRFINAVRYN